MRHSIAFSTLAATICLASGCALFPGSERASGASSDPEVFALEQDIFATVELVKARGNPRRFVKHAMTLPLPPTESIATYEYELPASCGAIRFRVMETGATQILEYHHQMGPGMEVVVRDYVAGDNPFISPGLWSTYDHIDMEVPAMMAELIRTSSPLLPQFYSRGLITSLQESMQQDLDTSYRNAVRSAKTCQ